MDLDKEYHEIEVTTFSGDKASLIINYADKSPKDEQSLYDFVKEFLKKESSYTFTRYSSEKVIFTSYIEQFEIKNSYTKEEYYEEKNASISNDLVVHARINNRDYQYIVKNNEFYSIHQYLAENLLPGGLLKVGDYYISTSIITVVEYLAE